MAPLALENVPPAFTCFSALKTEAKLKLGTKPSLTLSGGSGFWAFSMERVSVEAPYVRDLENFHINFCFKASLFDVIFLNSLSEGLCEPLVKST